ncbi:MAG TPA: NUDIX hydrolase [Streptosporangiaceae bacterium]
MLYRHAAGGIEVALIHRERRNDWTFPKGKLEPGEHVIAAAVREVTEETGIRPVLGRPLATVRYRVDGRPKRVDYWAALVDGPPPATPFVPNAEVDDLEWLPSAEATTRLTYAHDRCLLDLLLAPAGRARTPAAAGGDPLTGGVGSGPYDSGRPGSGSNDSGRPGSGRDGSGRPGSGSDDSGRVGLAGGDTVPCILLRHASAGHKNTWPGGDLLRPLDDQGQAEAQALAGLLACYAPVRVLSSAAERCLGTVRPYAERIGATIETDPAFTVPPADVPPADGDTLRAAAQHRMAELIAHPSPMVICAHRENIAVLLDEARATLPILTLPTPSPDDPAWRDVEPYNSVKNASWSPPKGGFWVLHIANGQLTALEHHNLSS